MHIKELVISSTSIIGIELLSFINITDANEIITTACQVAIAAATVYRLIKDRTKK